jgi:hypothetical protein
MTERCGPAPSWPNAWVTEGGAHVRWRREGAEVVAEWVGLLTAHVDAAGNVRVEISPGADPGVADKVRATGVAAFVRSLRGQPSLHGSAVAHGGRALVCLGESGAGKSTAAAELCATHGFALLADDVAGLELDAGRWWVVPTEASHWLATPARAKAPALAARIAEGRAELAVLVWLRYAAGDEAPRLVRIRGRRAHTVLSASMQRFERTEAQWLRELDSSAAIADTARLYELVRPRSWAAPTTAALLRSALDGAP